jgi:GntR family transcriptional regulator of vanillate catabolism
MRRQELGTKALISLRDAILSGELKAGDRLLELSLVERLKISRTPIRYALDRLADEGLVEKIRGGYSVRAFAAKEIRDAIRMRGTVEGVAVRIAAESKVLPQEPLMEARKCIAELDKLLRAKRITRANVEAYLDINRRFHESLVQMADSFVVQRMLKSVCALPFASPNAFVMAQREIGDLREVMFLSQQHHSSLLEAIENHESARAEAIAREHAEVSLTAMKRVLENAPDASQSVTGIELLRNRSANGTATKWAD